MTGSRATLTAAAFVLLSVLAGCGSGALTGTTATTPTTATTATTATTGITEGTPTTVPSTAIGATSSTTVTSHALPTTPRSTSTTQPAHPVGSAVQLTEADSGTIAVHIGQMVTLVLEDSALQWSSVTVAPDGLLQPQPSPAPPAHGQRATWIAAQRGTVTVSSFGTAWCAAGTVCPMFARPFKVTLIIG